MSKGQIQTLFLASLIEPTKLEQVKLELLGSFIPLFVGMIFASTQKIAAISNTNTNTLGDPIHPLVPLVAGSSILLWHDNSRVVLH